MRTCEVAPAGRIGSWVTATRPASKAGVSVLLPSRRPPKPPRPLGHRLSSYPALVHAPGSCGVPGSVSSAR
ncbi:hypothetical protein [Nocardioides campestrisoli]|uniref:hypothetical protein n=1 Tax=Nocardioides campestrisoli TaxID=2736757 RepID=UPI00163D7CAF|nr:hypothetical protein [Nocardioides campestrisoli]